MRPREDLVWDKNKEVSRTYRRSVYDFDYWANHRSTWRYFFHITSMPASRIVRSLLLPISWCARPCNCMHRLLHLGGNLTGTSRSIHLCCVRLRTAARFLPVMCATPCADVSSLCTACPLHTTA